MAHSLPHRTGAGARIGSDRGGTRMSIVLVTGSAGLIDAETVRFFAAEGFDIVGVDNDTRRVFLGTEASTAWSRQRLESEIKSYRHVDGDIRDAVLLEWVFTRYAREIIAVIHTAARPSHDWAANDPQTDFTSVGFRRAPVPKRLSELILSL
jgi:CDP-paratose 2-epimerase